MFCILWDVYSHTPVACQALNNVNNRQLCFTAVTFAHCARQVHAFRSVNQFLNRREYNIPEKSISIKLRNTERYKWRHTAALIGQFTRHEYDVNLRDIRPFIRIVYIVTTFRVNHRYVNVDSSCNWLVCINQFSCSNILGSFLFLLNSRRNVKSYRICDL